MDGRDAIPIFPLGTVVLFPHVRVPLYVFEPRYRDMTRDALAAGGRIGMVMVRPDDVAHMEGDPDVFEIGCEGRITAARPNPDGTYHLALDGVRRFRIVEEPPRPASRLYRTAIVEPLDDPYDDDDRPRVSQQRKDLLDLLDELVQRGDDPAEDPIAALSDLDDPALVNTVAQAIDLGPLEKQGLLECDGIPARYQRLSDLLAFRIAEANVVGSDPGVVH